MLERWNLQEIEDLRQARLYLMSLNPDHRALAESWLDEHPEEREAIEEEAGS